MAGDPGEHLLAAGEIDKLAGGDVFQAPDQAAGLALRHGATSAHSQIQAVRKIGGGLQCHGRIGGWPRMNARLGGHPGSGFERVALRSGFGARACCWRLGAGAHVRVEAVWELCAGLAQSKP